MVLSKWKYQSLRRWRLCRGSLEETGILEDLSIVRVGRMFH